MCGRILDHLWIYTILLICVDVCNATETCYPPGGVAGIVVATIIVTFVVGGLGVAFAWRRWTRKTGNQGFDPSRHGHHPNQQGSKAQGDFAFDNPYFKDQEGDGTDGIDKNKGRSSLNKNSIRSSKISEYSVKSKKPRNGKGHFMFGGGKKHRAYDDSCLAVEPERTVVSLRGHDFTGLGFNICGNMRDGIMVKDVLHRGPASESGLIKAGDKILNVTVSFTNIVYEDALTILSYASPYDVQLEIERVPDKSRSTPSSSKRLGSCSFNNSGQKLFHPLYRSQSIDDLTQIDKDTFPSHGIGPRRSQSIGVAAHKLAAHFKNSDSKLEDKDRSPMSLVLSTTGSLNEKMLANVMSDGNLHKNGLQWEKRFEDTLESEDVSSVTDKKSSSNDAKSEMTVGKASLSNTEKASSNSSQTQSNPQSYKQKNSKYLDSPYGKEKLEVHKSPLDKSDIDGDVSVQVHQPERVSGRRPKAMIQASGALWQLDRSSREDLSSVSNLDSPHHPQRSAMKRDNLPHSATNKFIQREEGNESDVSRDSLEVSSVQSSGKRMKQNCSVPPEKKTNSDSYDGLSSKQYQYDRKNVTNMENARNAMKTTESQAQTHAERVYANNIINKSLTNLQSPSIGSTDHRLSSDKLGRTDTKPDSDRTPYSNHREVVGKEVIHRHSPSPMNDRSIHGNSEGVSQNFANKTRIIVNGEASEPQNKLAVNSSGVQSIPISDYKSFQKSESESRSTENKTKQSPAHQQIFMKKTANPAGMFTQINPFQMPSKPKNVNLKAWTGREEMNRHSPNNANELTPSRSSYVTISDSSSQLNKRNALPDTHSYSQRMNDRTKTVVMSSYENSPYGSVHNSQNYKPHHQ